MAGGAYPSLEVASQNFFKLSEPSSVFLNGFAGTTFNFYDTGLPQFSLGGSRTLVAYGTNELLMDKYFLFQLGIFADWRRCRRCWVAVSMSWGCTRPHRFTGHPIA